ncbi:MAG: hypothetical protein ACAH83_06195 [Alphaproteobacteria bacterium]
MPKAYIIDPNVSIFTPPDEPEAIEADPPAKPRVVVDITTYIPICLPMWLTHRSGIRKEFTDMAAATDDSIRDSQQLAAQPKPRRKKQQGRKPKK